MCGGRLEIGIAQAPKNSQVIIARRRAVEACVGDLAVNGGRGAPIKQIAGDCKCLSPVECWHGRMKQESAHGVIERARTHSALPFCAEVYGHERRSRVPWAARKVDVAVLTNSVPLSA